MCNFFLWIARENYKQDAKVFGYRHDSQNFSGRWSLFNRRGCAWWFQSNIINHHQNNMQLSHDLKSSINNVDHQEDITRLWVINKAEDSTRCQRNDFFNEELMDQHEDTEGLRQLNEVELLPAILPFITDLKFQTSIPIENLECYTAE